MSAGATSRVRETFLPYSLPFIGEEEIEDVVDSLRSSGVSAGLKVKRLEEDFAEYVKADYAIAVSSCTAALHLSLAALGIGAGDDVIMPTLTFCSTANVVVHLGAKPVLVDVDGSMLMDMQAAERAITPRTKAIVPVHFGGQACDMDAVSHLARRFGLCVVEDGAHGAGCEYRGGRIGKHGDAVAFGLCAGTDKTAGEGGMITTNDGDLAARLRRLSVHGMSPSEHGLSKDAWKQSGKAGSWHYEVTEPGYDDNMTDVQAALGIHQLRRLDGSIGRRQELARRYAEAFTDLPELELPVELADRNHIFHVYPIQLDLRRLTIGRSEFIEELQAARIGSSVHFIPVHRHSYYASTFGYRQGLFPNAERIYERVLSLPLYTRMTEADVETVIDAVWSIVKTHRR